ncbi:DUF5020 family protein [Balneicella halophila]|nr:DUF5020 family protein [Balneicella halophila]
MKKLLLIVAFSCFAVLAMAQNVQLHYDFGKANDDRAADRDYLTATVEFFKPDKWGSTFFFVDFDFNAEDDGISVSYMELARNFKFNQTFPVQAHLEYNGGHFGADGFGDSFKNMVIVGGYYDWKITKGFTLGTMLGYKYIQDVEEGPDFQATVTWFKPFGKGFLFTGFADLWTEDKWGEKDGKKFIFVSEPQLWYSVTEHFKVGTEVEFSNNFVLGSNKFEIMPTVAVRWDI